MVQGVCGVGEQLSSRVKLTWRQGQPPPDATASLGGAAVGHGTPPPPSLPPLTARNSLG